MNKKLLFAAMSLAALTACTDNDFESKNMAQQEASPVVFEVLNNNDAFTRASMSGNQVVWSATDGDLFTLYHGATAAGWTTGYENATYKASAAAGSPATLTTPTVIKAGKAIMVWPVDTTFKIGPADALSISIPTEIDNIENNIPYVSDLLNIQAYAGYSETAVAPAIPTAYTTAGKDRKYAIYMRPMASQLTIKADYAGTDATLATLEAGEDGIEPIKVTSMDLLTTAGGGTTNFTKKIPLQFSGVANANWATVPNNVWVEETQFDIANIVAGIGAAQGQTDKLTAKDKCLTGNESCKFLLLPQAAIPATGVVDAGVVVNTIYGKVVIANGVHGSQYTAPEIADAWYRFVSATTAIDANEAQDPTITDANGKIFTYSEPKIGMMQTINNFSTATVTSATSVVFGEQVGAATTRYVKVLLNHLDMSALHVKTDKQLRDAARVWQKMGLNTVTVYLDGKSATDGDFEISQKTIQTIQEINAAEAEAGTGKSFTVQPCYVAGEACTAIVITGGGDIPDLRFIKACDMGTAATADDVPANVALNAGETWNFKDNVVIVDPANVATITNRGTMTNAATATLKMHTATPVAAGNQTTAVLFKNEGTWEITGGDLNVQFDVTNLGTLTIASGAEYHQDGAGNVFTNDAETLPQRFLTAPQTEKFGLIDNSGVLACANSGQINNYGLIEHADNNAKTYITANTAGVFNTPFGAANKIGIINLEYDNRKEENVSISNAATTGFVSVTVSPEHGAPSNGKLNLTNAELGAYVNYVIIKGGVTEISNVDTQIDYIEFDAGTNEIMWNVAAATYDGMVVFSPVNVKRGCKVTVNQSIYLAAKMYVGGAVVDGTNAPITSAICNGYYGNTTSKFSTMYLTY